MSNHQQTFSANVRKTSSSFVQIVLFRQMHLNRLASYLLLAGFAVIAAGGPALHHAPFFHLHECGSTACHSDCDSTESTQLSACGCGIIHSHESTESSDFRIEQGAEGQSHQCDGSCGICQFFSQLNLELVSFDQALEAETSFQYWEMPYESASVPTLICFLQRGPPANVA